MAKAVTIGAVDVLELGIPKRVLWSYRINEDAFQCDARRVRRHVRQAFKTPLPNVPKEIKRWWRAKLRRIGRQFGL
jgi:hypothetical protein